MLAAALPDDPLTLKALLGELAAQLAAHEARVAEQQDQLQQRTAEVTAVRDVLAAREREIARLELLIAVLRRVTSSNGEPLEHDPSQPAEVASGKHG